MGLVPWQVTVTNETKQVVPNPVVTVRVIPGAGLATIYSDRDGTSEVNPITGDANGFVQFWLSPGEYSIDGAKDGDLVDTWYFNAGTDFASRSDFVAAVTAGWVPTGGTTVKVDDLSWVLIPAGHSLYGTNPITDLPGWMPVGDVYPDHFKENTTPGTTPMQDAITEAWDSFDVVHLRAETYAIDAPANATTITKALVGKGHQVTVIEALHTAGDLLNFTGPGTSVSDILIENLTIRGVSGSTRTSGAHVKFEKPVVRFAMRGVRMQNYYDGIAGPEFNTCYLFGSWFSQSGIASGGKGRYTINNDRTVALFGAGAVDFHIIGCQFSGLNFASGSAASGLVAHFRSNSCDGVYITGGTHMFYADYAILTDPDGGTDANHNKIASIQIAGAYLDTAFISQIKMTGTTSSGVYREFSLSNVQLRDAMSGPAIELDAAVGRFSLSGGCRVRSAYAEGIKATNTGIYDLLVSDTLFEDNNVGNVSGVSEIDFDGSVAVLSSLIFTNTLNSGRAIRMRSNASDYDLDTINVEGHDNTADPILLDSTDGYVDGVQKVSNANGWYEKYKDGRLVCHRVADVDVTDSVLQTFLLPHNFIDRDVASANYSHLTSLINAAIYSSNIPIFGVTETAWFVDLAAAGTSSAPGTRAEQLALHAEGTWK